MYKIRFLDKGFDCVVGMIYYELGTRKDLLLVLYFRLRAGNEGGNGKT